MAGLAESDDEFVGLSKAGFLIAVRRLAEFYEFEFAFVAFFI